MSPERQKMEEAQMRAISTVLREMIPPDKEFLVLVFPREGTEAEFLTVSVCQRSLIHRAARAAMGFLVGVEKDLKSERKGDQPNG